MIKTESIFWQCYAYVYDLVSFIPQYKKMLGKISQELNIKDSDKILDAGCGTGNLSYFLKKNNNRAEIIGIDISTSMLARAKAKNKGADTKFIFFDMNKPLPFKAKTFDKIVAINSIYSVSNPKSTIRELFRVLKQNGVIIIVNPKSNTKFFQVYMEILNAGKNIDKLLLFFITLPLFVFNAIIKIRANNSLYHFIESEEWKKMFNSKEIDSISIQDTYIQSDLIKIIKS